MENFPTIVILQCKSRKNTPWLFHVLILLFNIMENKPKFKPNPKLKLNVIGSFDGSTSRRLGPVAMVTSTAWKSKVFRRYAPCPPSASTRRKEEVVRSFNLTFYRFVQGVAEILSSIYDLISV